MTAGKAGTERSSSVGEHPIRMAALLEQFPGIGRKVARDIANEIKPGDILDFEGFWLESNSFADEFIKTLVNIYGSEGLKRIRMINVPQLLRILFRKSFYRYAKRQASTEDSEHNVP